MASRCYGPGEERIPMFVRHVGKRGTRLQVARHGPGEMRLLSREGIASESCSQGEGLRSWSDSGECGPVVYLDREIQRGLDGH